MRVERLHTLTDDAAALLQEYYEAVGVVVRDGPEAMRALLEDPRSGLWVAFVDEAAMGCVVLRAGVPFASAAECKRLYVRPAYRGRGAAQRLMAALEAGAREAGFDWVYLDTHEAFQASVALYRGRGYVTCARYNQNPQATLFFRKRLREQGTDDAD